MFIFFKKIANGNFFEKNEKNLAIFFWNNVKFLAIFGQLNGNFPEGQLWIMIGFKYIIQYLILYM